MSVQLRLDGVADPDAGKVRVTLKVVPEVRDALKFLARRHGLSMSAYVTMLTLNLKEQYDLVQEGRTE